MFGGGVLIINRKIEGGQPSIDKSSVMVPLKKAAKLLAALIRSPLLAVVTVLVGGELGVEGFDFVSGFLADG